MRTITLAVVACSILSGCSSSDRLGPFDKTPEPVRAETVAPPPPRPRPQPRAVKRQERAAQCNPCMTDQCRRECSLDNPERKRHLYCIQMCVPPRDAPESRPVPAPAPSSGPPPRDPSWPTPPKTTCKFGELCQ